MQRFVNALFIFIIFTGCGATSPMAEPQSGNEQDAAFVADAGAVSEDRMPPASEDADISVPDGGRAACSERGCYSFCEPWSWRPNRNVEAMGYRGCCVATGRFRTLEEVGGVLHGQMLLKGSGPEVYYYNGVDRTRHLFPTSVILNSWHSPTDQDYWHDAEVCASVTQLNDTVLSTVTRGRDVTIRPGSMMVELASNAGYRWAVSRGRVLHLLRPPLARVALFPPSAVGREEMGIALLPDPLIMGYFAGTDIVDPDEYDARGEWETTIEREFGGNERAMP